jgi:hypothetical protein
MLEHPEYDTSATNAQPNQRKRQRGCAIDAVNGASVSHDSGPTIKLTGAPPPTHAKLKP